MLDGFSISGYRSFGPGHVQVSDLSKVNVFIGKNNCGKSNVLRFINHLGELVNRRGNRQCVAKLDPLLDYCTTDPSKRIVVGFQLKPGLYTKDIYKEIATHFGSNWLVFFPEFERCLWMYFDLAEDLKPTTESLALFAERIKTRCPDSLTNQLTAKLCNYTKGSQQKRAEDISKALHAAVKFQFSVHLIGAFRKISDSGDHPLMGSGLIKELRKLQSPELSNYVAARQRFLDIVEFVRTILGEPDATLEIPAEKDEIYVTIKRKILPLESLGTGIHELVIIAAAVTLVDGAIFCIEEPEIHLHPELQKKLIAYIASRTKNQYLIASHSNAFFDLPGVNIYGCALKGEYTQCSLVSSAEDKFAILRDLGYRPSDLLQANYIIWVEGPSDRIYINRWVNAKCPKLVEGLHYAIVFYGGRLLAHLSYDDPQVHEFIQLSCLNRNACIIMDSDKSNSRSRLNETKKRVAQDFESSGCYVWITAGRTIENYVSQQLLNRAFAKVHPKSHATFEWQQYSDIGQVRPNKFVDKVALARVVASESVDFTVFDLNKAMDNLVEAITLANS